MATKYKPNQKKRTTFSGAAIGVLLSVFLSVLSSGVLAILMVNERIPVSAMPFSVILIQITATLLGTLLTGKLVEEKKVIACAISCTAYFAVLLGTTLLFFNGQFKSLWTGLVCVLLSGAAATVLCARREGKNRAPIVKRKKYSR